MPVSRMFRIVFALVLLAVAPLRAEAPQTADTLLSVAMPDGRTLALTRADLLDLPMTEIATTTIWTDGVQRFRGVRLADLLAALLADGTGVTLVAANGYRIESDVTQLRPADALIAVERNGAAMGLRDKGPLWLVYDYDSSAEFRTEVFYSNSIWQLDRLELSR